MRISVMLTMICAITLIAGCEGPVGPRGPAGPPGEGADIQVYRGVLAENALVEESYWEIIVGQDLDDWLVLVLVREGADYAWYEPVWDILEFGNGETSVAIYQNEVAAAGFDYRIALIE